MKTRAKTSRDAERERQGKEETQSVPSRSHRFYPPAQVAMTVLPLPRCSAKQGPWPQLHCFRSFLLVVCWLGWASLFRASSGLVSTAFNLFSPLSWALNPHSTRGCTFVLVDRMPQDGFERRSNGALAVGLRNYLQTRQTAQMGAKNKDTADEVGGKGDCLTKSRPVRKAAVTSKKDKTSDT